MIITVTPNPALDKFYRLDSFDPNRPHRISQQFSLAGGKGINAARVLASLGVPVAATGVLAGFTGKRIEQLLREDGIDCRFTWTEGESRLCTTVVSENDQVHFELLEKGPVLTVEEWRAVAAELASLAKAASMLLIAGNPERGTDHGVLALLLEALQQTAAKVFLDARGEWLGQAIKQSPDVVKVNRDEFAGLVGGTLTTEALIAECRALCKTNNIELFIVTDGAGPIHCLTAEGGWVVTPPTIEPVSAVGCGDTFSAGMLYGYHRGWELPRTLTYAAVLAAASALTLGAGLFDPVAVGRLEREVRIATI